MSTHTERAAELHRQIEAGEDPLVLIVRTLAAVEREALQQCRDIAAAQSEDAYRDSDFRRGWNSCCDQITAKIAALLSGH